MEQHAYSNMINENLIYFEQPILAINRGGCVHPMKHVDLKYEFVFEKNRENLERFISYQLHLSMIFYIKTTMLQTGYNFSAHQ